MVVLINGSFGVGKTTVAKLLRRALARSVIYDPEWFGFVLKRIPKRIYPENSKPDDFQHSKLWRASVAQGVRLFRLFGRGTVIVPMAFCDRGYFDEVVAGVTRFDRDLKIFCLRASLETIKQRLVGRGDLTEGAGSEWIARRIVECVEAHRDSHFGEPVETENRTPAEICEEIVLRLGQSPVEAI
jgi:chloramphenicol 3-O-phosphotransferase